MVKKICFVTTIGSTLRAFVLKLAEYLHSTGEFDITFICSPDEALQSVLPDYIHMIPVKMARGISLGGVKATGEIYRICKREKFDLIQYSTPNASFYVSIAAKMAGVPVRLYCQWGMAYVGFSGMKRQIFKAIEKSVCRRSTWVEPDSFGNLKFSHAEKLYPEQKGSVIWNGSASGVDLKKFDISQQANWRGEIRGRYGIPDDAMTYIFIGRVTRDKGVNELFAATRRIMREKNIYLLMVGSVEGSETLDETLYAWSQSEDKVIYCGFTNEVEKYLAASDVYVLPSYREGFGSSVIEAEAMGRPVIVSDIPGPTDAMKKDVTGLVVEKGNAAALETAMMKLYQNRGLREKLGASAYEFAKDGFEQEKLFACILKDRQALLNR